jgi:hypothetical protein
MLHISAKARALVAGAAVALVAVLAVVGIARLAGGGDAATTTPSRPANVGGLVVVEIPGAGRLQVALPKGWGITNRMRGGLTLASPGTCHTATLVAFVDRTGESPEMRAEHMLGYLTGREFDRARLWRGTTTGGRGYAVYDPPSLVGVEAVRKSGKAVVIVLHGLPTHSHCSRHAALAPRWELSRLLQDLQVVGPQLAAPFETA